MKALRRNSLEKNNSKSDILWFYLNQVPYASHRRGISQAARFYFDRDVETLDIRENLALAVLVRAPDYYDLHRHPGRIQPPLAGPCHGNGKTGRSHGNTAARHKRYTALSTQTPGIVRHAPHFVRFVLNHPGPFNGANPKKIHTTLDGTLQQRVQTLLDTALASHRDRERFKWGCPGGGSRHRGNSGLGRGIRYGKFQALATVQLPPHSNKNIQDSTAAQTR